MEPEYTGGVTVLEQQTLTPAFQTDLGKLYHDDCLNVLPKIDSESVDLIFADPPFNLGKNYGKKVNDQLQEHEYIEWCQAWIAECVRVLRAGGSFFIYNLPKWNIELGHMLNAHGMMFRHWIAADIKMSLPIPGRLYPSHYSLLYYSKGKPKAFTRPRLPIAVCRHCGGDIKDYGGHKNKLNPEGINLSDVWIDIPPVRHRSTKNRGANELPPKLLRRVMEIASRPGDLVLDPFGGSGTTFAVAEEMHRHWVGVELGECEPIVNRLQGLPSLYTPKSMGDSGKGMR